MDTPPKFCRNPVNAKIWGAETLPLQDLDLCFTTIFKFLLFLIKKHTVCLNRDDPQQAQLGSCRTQLLDYFHRLFAVGGCHHGGVVGMVGGEVRYMWS